jgi:folate-binding protein YgfZ
MPEKTPLDDVEARAGAQFVEQAGWLMPEHYGNLAQEYRSARERAALFDVSNRGKVEVSGADAVTFLQNLATNDVAGLPAGAGCEVFFTTAQAKVVAHALAYRLPAHDQRQGFWLDTVPGLAGNLIKHLDRYLISEQVELADRTADLAQIHLAGPQADALLRGVLSEDIPQMADLQHLLRSFGSGAACPIRRHSPLGVPGHDILCPPAEAAAVWEALTRAGAVPAGLQAYEILRVEAGTPSYGKDVDETTLALEVGRTRQAICYTKGCFLGQEPLVRIRDLGHVNRSLLGLKLSGGAVPAGAKLFRDGKEVGRVTSSVVSPALGTGIALAYVRRGNDPGTMVEVEAEGARSAAEVVFLPFGVSGAGKN